MSAEIVPSLNLALISFDLLETFLEEVGCPFTRQQRIAIDAARDEIAKQAGAVSR